MKTFLIAHPGFTVLADGEREESFSVYKADSIDDAIARLTDSSHGPLIAEHGLRWLEVTDDLPWQQATVEHTPATVKLHHTKPGKAQK